MEKTDHIEDPTSVEQLHRSDSPAPSQAVLDREIRETVRIAWMAERNAARDAGQRRIADSPQGIPPFYIPPIEQPLDDGWKEWNGREARPLGINAGTLIVAYRAMQPAQPTSKQAHKKAWDDALDKNKNKNKNKRKPVPVTLETLRLKCTSLMQCDPETRNAVEAAIFSLLLTFHKCSDVGRCTRLTDLQIDDYERALNGLYAIEQQVLSGDDA